MRKLFALAWLALGIGVAISSVIDLGESHWRISWLAVDVVGTLLAWTCSAILFFGHGGRNVAGVVIATLFVLYCVYLFILSPPDSVNGYSLLGSAVILLGIATIAILARRKAKSEGATT